MIPGLDSILKELLSQGALGIVAAIALFLLDKSHKDSLRREDNVIKAQAADRKILIEVLQENARTMTALQYTIEAIVYDERHKQAGRPPRPRGAGTRAGQD